MRNIILTAILVFKISSSYGLNIEEKKIYGKQNASSDLNILSSTDIDIFDEVMTDFSELNSNLNVTYTVASTKDIYEVINNVNKDINLKIDQTLFEIAIRNLLDNAIKYSPTENDVDVTLEINGDDYLIKFMNISLNKLNFDFKKIMKRFSRGYKNEKVIGTGLGLSIVSEATKSLKGNLKVSKLKGNVFCAILYLPLS